MYLHSLSVLNCFGNADGQHSVSSKQGNAMKIPCFLKGTWCFMSKKKCSGLSLNNVACSCALKMIFLSLPYNIHQRTLQKLQECVVLKGTAYHSHSAPYQSDMITAQLKLFLSLFFFFLFLFSHKMSLRICKLFHFGIQRQASKSTVVKKKG